MFVGNETRNKPEEQTGGNTSTDKILLKQTAEFKNNRLCDLMMNFKPANAAHKIQGTLSFIMLKNGETYFKNLAVKIRQNC